MMRTLSSSKPNIRSADDREVLGRSPGPMMCRIDAILRPGILRSMNWTTHSVSARFALWLNFVWMAISVPAVSPELHRDGSVTFRLNQPGAHEVLVALAGLETPLKMSETKGIWSVTSAPLESGTYWYSFVVDGKAELDPFNDDVTPNYQYLNSVVRVPGTGPEPWERTEVPHGEVHRHFYESKIVKGLPNGRSEYFVYTPPGYESHPGTIYPTLFLLHGLSQGAGDWTTMGGANFVLDNLIAQGKAKPMVVVMPLGYGDMALLSKGLADPDFGPVAAHSTTLFRDVLMTEIVPRVEAEYRVAKTRTGRAIAGLSMGGFESLDIGLNSAGKDGTGSFAWVGGFSAPAQSVDLPATNGEAAKLRLLWISCGTEDPLLEPNRKLIGQLKGKGYAVKAVETPGAHIWPVWDRNLVDFVQLLF
jgi:enterochelin esterase-like enzyme